MVSKSLRGTILWGLWGLWSLWGSTTTIVSPYICLRDTPKHRVSLAMGQYKSSKHRLSWLWERGGGNINSIWENNEYGWEEGGESSLTPERVVYPKGGVGILNLSCLRISMDDVISRRVWEGVLPILEAKWGLWGVPRKCGQIWCLCWAMVILGVKPGSWV